MTRVDWYPARLRAASLCEQRYDYSYDADGRRKWVEHNSYKGQWGTMFHQSLAVFDRWRALGLTRAEATNAAVHEALTCSWDWEPVSKLPVTRMTRHNLARAVVWYCDDQPEKVEDGFKVALDQDGNPMIEIDAGLSVETRRGQRWICARYDAVGHLGGVPALVERKSTEYDIGPAMGARYTPDVQVDAEDLVANNPEGFWRGGQLIIEAHQIGVGFSRWYRWAVDRSTAQRREAQRDFIRLIEETEDAVDRGRFMMRRTSCSLYERKDEPGSGCPFRGACSRDAENREEWLANVADQQGRPLFRRSGND